MILTLKDVCLGRAVGREPLGHRLHTKLRRPSTKPLPGKPCPLYISLMGLQPLPSPPYCGRSLPIPTLRELRALQTERHCRLPYLWCSLRKWDEPVGMVKKTGQHRSPSPLLTTLGQPTPFCLKVGFQLPGLFKASHCSHPVHYSSHVSTDHKQLPAPPRQLRLSLITWSSSCTKQAAGCEQQRTDPEI